MRGCREAPISGFWNLNRLRKESTFGVPPLKGRLIFEGFAASLKRCPDTNRICGIANAMPDTKRICATGCLGLQETVWE